MFNESCFNEASFRPENGEISVALIGMRNVSWGFGDTPLLENITWQIEKGERVCLLGRNGVGKSTLLKFLHGEMTPDKGEIWQQKGVAVSALKQEVPEGFATGTVFDVVAQGLGEKGRALAQYRTIRRNPSPLLSNEDEERCGALQEKFSADDEWGMVGEIESILSRTELDGEWPFSRLSAGMKRRTLFARALVTKPDLLLLDEPTNHLDIDSILWMEELILRHVKTVLFVTHDRAFLKRIATRIVEIDRGRLFSYDCRYATYLERKQAAMVVEEKQDRVSDRKRSAEETWIRQGIKARRTRNEGRVRALLKMREEFRARRKKTANVKLQVHEGERTGKLVMKVEGVSFSYEDNPILEQFNTTILRGDKVGIIGPNGAGKTTLLKILLKNMEPDIGTVRHGTNLQVLYFDQLREQLDEEKTVAENIGEGNSFIIFNGRKRHVITHLRDFLFSRERCSTPVRILSGGEKNRLLLARLFTQPANILILDEPTNDLDAETLELLEELLFEYKGTLLLVSHDRAFLNNVVTSTLVFEGKGRLAQYAGGYDDWLIQRPEIEDSPPALKAVGRKEKKREKPAKKRTLKFKEKKELSELPDYLHTLETEKDDLFKSMSDPMYYKKGKDAIAAAKVRLEELEKEIDAAYSRWEFLESIEEY